MTDKQKIRDLEKRLAESERRERDLMRLLLERQSPIAPYIPAVPPPQFPWRPGPPWEITC